MKHILITTIAAVLLTGCGEQQKSIPQTEIKQDSATANASGISIDNDSWGRITSQNAEFYASNDVHKDQIDLTKKWYEIATKAWGNYGPTEFRARKGNIKAVKQDLADSVDVHGRMDTSRVSMRG